MKTCNWETIFDEGENKMVHIFSTRVRVEWLRELNSIGLFKDGAMIDRYTPDEGYGLDQHLAAMIKVAKEAERLEKVGVVD